MADADVEKLLKRYSGHLTDMILKTGWFKTRDEDNPNAKPMPLPDKPYLRYLIEQYEKYPRLLIPKSRQVMVTWSWAAYGLARCLTRTHFLAIYQTKREEDAVGFMNRVHFLYQHLPKEIQEARPAKLDNSLKTEFAKRDSRFWGIPQGADIIRSNTVSLFFADEVNFQPNARASLTAAMPSLGKNGQGIWGSSAAAGGLMIPLVHGNW